MCNYANIKLYDISNSEHGINCMISLTPILRKGKCTSSNKERTCNGHGNKKRQMQRLVHARVVNVYTHIHTRTPQAPHVNGVRLVVFVDYVCSHV